MESGLRGLINKVRRKVTYAMLIEAGMMCAVVAIAFGVSTAHFLNESVESLVPFSALSECDSYSEVYTLVPQNIYEEFPGTLIATNYKTGKTSNGVIDVLFFANWTSCLKESVDSNFHLEPETNSYYQYVSIDLADRLSASFYGNSSTNGNCFKINCGFKYEWIEFPTRDIRKDFTQYLNDSVFIEVPYNYNDLIEVDDLSNATLGNSQLITAIYGTNNSVTASCSVSLAGYYLQMFSISNSVTNTGTYLCKQFVRPLQAVSSGLSIALTVVGLCRLYLSVKSFLAKV